MDKEITTIADGSSESDGESNSVAPGSGGSTLRAGREWLILAALILALFLQLGLSVRQWSITSDEIDHLHAGYR